MSWFWIQTPGSWQYTGCPGSRTRTRHLFDTKDKWGADWVQADECTKEFGSRKISNKSVEYLVGRQMLIGTLFRPKKVSRG